MTRLTIDAELLRKLLNLTSPLELCDERGNVLAHVWPKVDPSQWEPLEPPASEEELDAREKAGKWYTTAEVLSHLESL